MKDSQRLVSKRGLATATTTARWRSYSSLRMGPVRRIRELIELYRMHRSDVVARVSAVVREMEDAEERMLAAGCKPLEGASGLDVGSGQHTGHTLFLANRCNMTAIDLSIVPEGMDWRSYLDLVRKNGVMRLVKTAGRKILGIDREFADELRRQLGAEKLPKVRLLQMDAANLRFPDQCFDFVFSRSAWEHFEDPAAALREVSRVLRPGGAAHITVHLYTSDGGCHDPRILSGRRGDLPFWAHLRPDWRGRVYPNSYLNELRLARWRELFESHMPGVRIMAAFETNPAAKPALQQARAGGELADYSDEELLTVSLHAVWRKPS